MTDEERKQIRVTITSMREVLDAIEKAPEHLQRDLLLRFFEKITKQMNELKAAGLTPSTDEKGRTLH